MKSLIFTIVLFCIAAAVFGYFKLHNTSQQLTIGVIVPMEHAALTSIVQGFTDTISKATTTDTKKVKVIVKNAQGDLNMQRTIIKQLQHSKVDMLVPIGTATTQMVAQMESATPIVSLAANPNGFKNSTNINYILDELGAEKPLMLLRKVYPDIKKITLLTSQSEKIFQEVSVVQQIAKSHGITVQHLAINNMNELLTISRAIAIDSEAVFILKDHLIVSGIKLITNEAKKKNIPVISTDEGSVASGAAFALGVSEYSIGTTGGTVAQQVITGSNLVSNVTPITDLKLFYNANACRVQKVSIADLLNSAAKVDFYVEVQQI